MTSWTVILTRRARTLPMSQARARQNARRSALECAMRRREREEAELAMQQAAQEPAAASA
ncbi:hypothetical protein [Nocardioides deserti]|uniref:Uncharacterized protein n=1 Tax=Nocardioides deserti TaxID=1588644 RepID=A0ABR6U555_9ACTN|nr:hypothetical protein [Nocardioides deserti]MBC2959298.1 hypothetical protein [Nocardioides deserti]GGO68114.1 hypothetical protein GCM10012276_01170 [Nocardioides deserti]